MKAIITVGLGFGDEGKGAWVDALTRETGAEWVIRYCGGAQAGHNVELPDGRRHTFSQFGAGTLAGARTYLGSRMIVCPWTLGPEADHLCSLGIDNPWDQIAAHPDCLVSTYYHVLMNRLRELARGANRHGSCGLGIGETRKYWLDHGLDSVFVRDLQDRSTLRSKLALLRDRLLLEIQELDSIDRELSSFLFELTPSEEANSLRSATDRLAINDQLPIAETLIFEGAQGVLLDEWKGFHPYTTWSTTTPHHAWEMLDDGIDREVSVVGITRAYSTRHGAGPFPAHCPEMTARMSDRGNPENAWQGGIRFGPLDLPLLQYAAQACDLDGILVSGIDQLSPQPSMITEYQNGPLHTPHCIADQQRLTKTLQRVATVRKASTEQEILDTISSISPVAGISRGPSHCDRDLFDTHSCLTKFASRHGQTSP